MSFALRVLRGSVSAEARHGSRRGRRRGWARRLERLERLERVGARRRSGCRHFGSTAAGAARCGRDGTANQRRWGRGFFGLTMDTDSLYLADSESNTIDRVSKRGGARTPAGHTQYAVPDSFTPIKAFCITSEMKSLPLLVIPLKSALPPNGVFVPKLFRACFTLKVPRAILNFGRAISNNCSETRRQCQHAPWLLGSVALSDEACRHYEMHCGHHTGCQHDDQHHAACESWLQLQHAFAKCGPTQQHERQ